MGDDRNSCHHLYCFILRRSRLRDVDFFQMGQNDEQQNCLVFNGIHHLCFDDCDVVNITTSNGIGSNYFSRNFPDPLHSEGIYLSISNERKEQDADWNHVYGNYV